MKSEQDRDFVQSLARGLDVLQSFSGGDGRLTLSEVAQRTDLTRGTARRFLMTLVRLGHIATDGKLFWLRPQVLSIGHSFLSALPWWRHAHPVIEDTARTIGQACNVSVLDGTDITFVVCVANRETIPANPTLGSRQPAYPTASGRVLLATLSDADLKNYFAGTKMRKLTPATVTRESEFRRILDAVREQGYCLVDGEFQEGLRAVAVPLISRSGRVLAAISVYAGTDRAAFMSNYLPALKKAQAMIQRTA